ncbi:MAG: hypothetical protein KJ874_10810, partial [Acidobacteria bacterium]|nr:hypothetical protein [Acidobacteriota bacterium]
MDKKKNGLILLLTGLFLIAVISSAMADSQYSGVLGKELKVQEVAGSSVYNGVWTRRAGTDIFDAVWNETITDVIEIESINGNQIVLYRQGNGGRYYGTLSADGSKITSGTASWYSPEWYWGATITGNYSSTSSSADSNEVYWPEITEAYTGSASAPMTMDISAKGPCLLIVTVFMDNYIAPILSLSQMGPGWRAFDFPHEQGGSKHWVNGVLCNNVYQEAKSGSEYFCENRFKIHQAKTFKFKFVISSPAAYNNAGAFMRQYKQYCKITYSVHPLDADVPWGKQTDGPVIPPDIVNETEWIVGSTQWQVSTYPAGGNAG